MSQFRTEIIVSKRPDQLSISHTTSLCLIGSCFTETIGGKLEELKFPVDINPTGIVYNPISVENTIRFLLENRRFTEGDLRSRDGRWFSLYHHSRFSDSNATECLRNINDRLTQGAEFLANADCLLLTFGTAWVYELRKTGEPVSNCHKLPSNNFTRRLLDVAEIVDRYKALLTSLFEFNPKVRVIFTISPVRHLKDGAHGNQVSKSVLLLAVERLTTEIDGNCVTYFPAYEILLDDLRDYRFYADDMVHPSTTAVDYIWKKFADVYMTSETQSLIADINEIVAVRTHKPFDPKSEAHKKFCRNQIAKINGLLENNPDLNFGEELGYFQKCLAE